MKKRGCEINRVDKFVIVKRKGWKDDGIFIDLYVSNKPKKGCLASLE